jgi:myo-inositol-1-phosphate synthase
MTAGMGAVCTTLIAGVEAVRQGLAKPIGSLTQMGTIRLGKRTDANSPLIKDFVPIAKLDDLVFTGWDIFGGNLYDAPKDRAGARPRTLEQIRPFLESIEPMPAVFDQYYVKRLHRKADQDRQEQVRPGQPDPQRHRRVQDQDRPAGADLDRVDRDIHEASRRCTSRWRRSRRDSTRTIREITPSQMYAWAALKEGIPFINGAPNLTVDIPAMNELSRKMNAPICGKDFKTGQTMIKSVLAPAFKTRMLGVSGWYSTNILGNRDGEVLDDPESFKTKEESKLGLLEMILQPELYPDLYKDIYHKVRINYYPPRGDNKEGWDNIDIFGWLGYPMQLKVDFLCRDSILAAPLALDLCLFMDLAARTPSLRGLGIQEWLSFYFKAPDSAKGVYPEHDLFIQSMKLKNTLRHIMGQDLITHLGLDYYDE